MPFVHLTESREILFAVDINTTFSTLVVSVVVVVISSVRESELESIVSLWGVTRAGLNHIRGFSPFPCGSSWQHQRSNPPRP